MPAARLESMFTGFCPVAAATVPPGPDTRYRVTLPTVTEGKRTGILHLCAWPAFCDSLDSLKVDTKTVHVEGGAQRQYHFVVVGDPCAHPDMLARPFYDMARRVQSTLAAEAPELMCGPDGALLGTTLSDGGYVIVSMFHDDVGQRAHRQEEFSQACRERGKVDFHPGDVFRMVAAVTPIKRVMWKGLRMRSRTIKKEPQSWDDMLDVMRQT